jgi:TldD protein
VTLYIRSLLIFFSVIVGPVCLAQPAADKDELFMLMKSELDREMTALKKAEVPPYYMDYMVRDVQIMAIGTSFGSLVRSQGERSRLLTTHVKVGDYLLDNSHPIESADHNSDEPPPGNGSSLLPTDNKIDAIRWALWRTTQNEYIKALSEFKRIKSPTTKLAPSEAPDFSKEQPTHYYENPLPAFDQLVNQKDWEAKLKELSGMFNNDPDLITGEASLQVQAERKYFLSSENSSVVQNATTAYLYVQGDVRTSDGDIAPLYKSYFAATPAELPSAQIIRKDIAGMLEIFRKLKTAPLAEPYTGPAILDAHVAGVFFHEIFGHRVEGHRLRNEHDGQTFKAKIEEQVLPTSMNIIFDPSLSSYDNQPLNGSYRYDDEGIQGRRVEVVEKGILKTFLMSRAPLERIHQSNGHGRAAAGSDVVSRQSNLLVETTKPVTSSELRKLFIAECLAQGKKYGYFFKDVVGGFTTTDRYSPNAFNIFPTEVYRVYTDGRPDELVRGVDLIGTPLAMFAEIEAAGDHKEIFTGFCGAESGSVPVSAVSPALFVRRIETQKKPETHQEKTILSRPSPKNK